MLLDLEVVSQLIGYGYRPGIVTVVMLVLPKWAAWYVKSLLY